MQYKVRHLMAAVAVTAFWATAAHAQDSDYAQLMSLDENSLEREIQMRYDAGLATSLDPAIIAANDSRYLWALETKVQCGIALGFLKSSTRDEVSIGKCVQAYGLMTYVAPPPPVRRAPAPPPPPPVQRPSICDDEIAGIVFFDFDMASLTPEAANTLNTITTNIAACGWTSFNVVGHTDQAGSDQYNMGLSQERAASVKAAMTSRGVSANAITTAAQGESNPRVPLPDGTRSPQNRRVEISAD